MAFCKVPSCGVLLLLFFIATCFLFQCFAAEVEVNQTARLLVDASQGRLIPETLFGIFFEVCLSVTWNNVVRFCWFSVDCGAFNLYFSFFLSAGDQSCWSWWTVGRACEQQRSFRNRLFLLFCCKGHAYVIFSTLIFLLYLEFKNPLCLINVSDQSLIAVSGSFVSQI